jgi:uncharacterized protein YjiS (DUF1127 family)
MPPKARQPALSRQSRRDRWAKKRRTVPGITFLGENRGILNPDKFDHFGDYEGAMSANFTSTNLTETRWSRVAHCVVEWHRSVRSRQELLNFSRRQLQDIGLARCPVVADGYKPFWLA